MKKGSIRARRGDEGFTLVELMVTVSIIGVLAAVSIPRYVSYVRSSQTAEVGQMAGAIVAAARAYADQQSLTPAGTVTAISTNSTLALASGTGGTTPASDFAVIAPQLALPAGANFDYIISAFNDTTSNEAVFCIKATGRASAGVPGGIILYSSANERSTTNGWEGRMNRQHYVSGAVTSAKDGGSGAAAGTAKAPT